MATTNPSKLQAMLKAMADELEAEGALMPIDKEGHALRVRIE